MHPSTVHPSTFAYLKPTDLQLLAMEAMRNASKDYVIAAERYIPDGPDKTYLLRKFREVGMWANVSIIRHADGSPR